MFDIIVTSNYQRQCLELVEQGQSFVTCMFS